MVSQRGIEEETLGNYCDVLVQAALSLDFNDLLSVGDKRGRVEHPNWMFTGFRSAIMDCRLSDISLQGYPFTWSRHRGKTNFVEERLDRALGNSDWMS